MGFLGSLFGGGGSSFQAQGLGNQAQALTGSNQGVNSSLTQQQSFLNALGVGGGAAQGAQQQLLGQLQQGAQGQGPNPALAQLANTTGQNVANQAALQAGQRGIQNNPGLASRNIAQQGAAIQQQATGQAALQAAQQQLAQQQLLGQQSGMMVGQQANALQGMTGANLANQQQLLGMQANMNSANAGVQGATANQQGGLLQTGLKGVGSALGIAGMFGTGGASAAMAKGGEVKRKSILVDHIHNLKGGGKIPGQAKKSGDSYSNDTVPAMLSPGEIVLPRSVTKDGEAPEKAAQFVAAILSKGKRK